MPGRSKQCLLFSFKTCSVCGQLIGTLISNLSFSCSAGEMERQNCLLNASGRKGWLGPGKQREDIGFGK
jgi:hypothetical protein